MPRGAKVGEGRRQGQLRDQSVSFRESLHPSSAQRASEVEYPHRAKYLLLVAAYLRRLLDAHEQLVDEVESAFAG